MRVAFGFPGANASEPGRVRQKQGIKFPAVALSDAAPATCGGINGNPPELPHIQFQSGGIMNWSLRIGSIRGTQLNLHWTFLLLLGWVFFSSLSGGGGVPTALGAVAFVATVFGCVLLHELGHVFAARGYGIPTTDVTLLPIGGVARLQRIPEKPMQEFWVALAGPAVNVAIAAVLFVYLKIVAAVSAEPPSFTGPGNFGLRVMWVNVGLVVFNMLPAFPMDGGRVLRALLAMRLARQRATRIASGVGQIMAVLFAMLGLFVIHNPLLLVIAFFIFIGAEAEARMVEVSTAIHDLRVADAMMTRFRTLDREDSLAHAVEELIAGSQHDFPVMADGKIVGLLRRNDLVRGLSQNGPTGRVAEVMSEHCPIASVEEPLETAFAKLREESCDSIPVLRDRTLLGLLTRENVSEVVMVNSAMERKAAGVVSAN